MSDDDRVQEALAAYLEHLEMGGPEPDFSYLTGRERRDLQELVDALELTEGIAFGRGRDERAGAVEAETREGERLLAELRPMLPPATRLEPDDNRLVARVGDVDVVDRFVIGTFGGRVRVWLVDVASIDEVEDDAEALRDLGRAFRTFPDTSAIALAGRDLSCLVVEPEDTAPQIRVPAGSFVSRRYKRAIGPVAEAIPSFLDDLIPYWAPMPAFDRDSGVRIDVAEIAGEAVRAAIEDQRRAGERARKGNPKKDALTGLGERERRAVGALVAGLADGSVSPGDVEARIERLADR